jgi:uncharacterized UPF0160 family protein
MSDKIKIVTHNAGFHTDDVFAVATLSLILEKEGKEFSITRSRDLAIAEEADYLVDFGGFDDPATNRFDHHQEGKAGERANGIPYASFGLVWKKFGETLCGTKAIADKVDRVLVQPIDALDNGVPIVKSLRSDVLPLDLGYMTHIFYPTWKEDPAIVDERFLQVVSYAKTAIMRMITWVGNQVEAEAIVLEKYNASSDKRLIVVENNNYPWNEVLSKFPEPLFAVYYNISGDTWSMKCIRDDVMSFDCRKFLPEAWAGKRDEELEKATGVPGAVFCHNDLFMCVAKTKEGILKLAELALAD